MAEKKTKVRAYHQVARAESTEELRRGILKAFSKLALTTWLDELTLDDVAQAAGTTRQTVIRMFGSKIGLLMSALPAIDADITRRRKTGPGATLEEIAAGVVADLEVNGGMLMSVLALAPRNPELEPALAYGRSQHSRLLREALAPWLDPLPMHEAERRFLGCIVATDTYTWALLRKEHKKSVSDTERTITDMLRRILGDAPTLQQPKVETEK